MYKKIFVPVDDSRASSQALEEAVTFAKICGAEIHLAHVVDLSQFGWGGPSMIQSKEVQDVSTEIGSKIINRCKEVLEQNNIPYNYEIMESAAGNVVHLLAKNVRSNQCDLVIMGTHGFSGVMHLLMGSVAEGLLKEVEVPIMFVKQTKK